MKRGVASVLGLEGGFEIGFFEVHRAHRFHIY